MEIITLIRDYVSGLLDAEDDFLEHLDTLDVLEQNVSELSQKMAADFIGLVLTNADQLIRESGKRKGEFVVQRERQRTLISSIGDIVFTHTLYKDKSGKTRCLLDELIRLPDRERFTAVAEAKILNEAEVHSYQHAADSIRTGGQTITKETVMNKIHAIDKELPEMEEPPEEKREREYLYIEADEDHIHRQKDGEEQGCFLGKLIYLFEGKEEVCNGRRQLVRVHYFGGNYPGSERNAALWQEVEEYIREHYDQDVLKCVYINGDGAGWIRTGLDYVYKSKMVADRFHLMRYINRAARCTLDSEEETKGRFYKYIYKNNLTAAKRLLTQIQNHCDGSDRAVEECRTYLKDNWEYIQRAFHDKHVLGCSAEGHVSSVYSERMSSRPMGWSATGTDRMCKLRCFVRNYGREKVIDLVNYRREREMRTLTATGTDDLIEEPARKEYTAHQHEMQRYAESMYTELVDKRSVRKILSIRTHLDGI